MADTNFRNLLKTKELTLAKLAEAVGIDKATATRWAQRRIPAERVLRVEKLTGIPRHELRPDIYPPPEN